MSCQTVCGAVCSLQSQLCRGPLLLEVAPRSVTSVQADLSARQACCATCLMVVACKSRPPPLHLLRSPGARAVAQALALALAQAFRHPGPWHPAWVRAHAVRHMPDAGLQRAGSSLTSLHQACRVQHDAPGMCTTRPLSERGLLLRLGLHASALCRLFLQIILPAGPVLCLQLGLLQARCNVRPRALARGPR